MTEWIGIAGFFSLFIVYAPYEVFNWLGHGPPPGLVFVNLSIPDLAMPVLFGYKSATIVEYNWIGKLLGKSQFQLWICVPKGLTLYTDAGGYEPFVIIVVAPKMDAPHSTLCTPI